MCDEPDASDDDSNASRGHEDENMDDDEEEWDEDDELNDQVADHEASIFKLDIISIPIKSDAQ